MLNKDNNHKDSTERGASAIEYALLLACLVLVMVGALSAFGGTIKSSIEELTTKVQNSLRGGDH